MNKTSQPMFPSKEAREQWISSNCSHCKRSARQRINGNGMTSSNCKVYDDIQARMSNPIAEVAYRSCRVVLMRKCPYYQKVRLDDASMELFN